MKVAVLGSGNGGLAVAFDCARHAHDVYLFDFESFPDNIISVQQQGGIHATGKLEGFAPISLASHDIEPVIRDADIIYAVGPAYSTRPFAVACRGHLKKGQTVIICPGSCMGSIEFKQGAHLGLGDEDVVVAETSTLPYAVRILGPGRIRVFLKVEDGLFVAAVPSRNTARVIEQIQDVFPAMAPAKNVLQTSLQNGNPVIHPSITLLNTAMIERVAGDFFFYEQGVTPAVGRLIRAIDQERIAIGMALNVKVVSEPELGFRQGYMAEPNYDTGYSQAPGFRGIKAQPTLDYRYFNEDVGYGLVFWKSLAGQIHVDTPVISAIIRLVSVLMERNYAAQTERTMESLGLSGLTAAQLEHRLG